MKDILLSCSVIIICVLLAWVSSCMTSLRIMRRQISALRKKITEQKNSIIRLNNAMYWVNNARIEAQTQEPADGGDEA